MSAIPAAKRNRPELVTVNGKDLLVGGRWNNEAMANYVLDHGQKDWITIGQLARVGCGGNTKPNQKRVRARLALLFLTLCERGIFLAVEYSGNHRSASAIKVADLASAEDRQNVQDKLDRMRRHRELTEERYDRALALLYATGTS